jgi:thiamine-phosphate pyrophosphorylase
MKLVVLSPPDDRAREQETVGALFEAGLVRYHLRKPAWSAERTAGLLGSLPPPWRGRVILHYHHEIAHSIGVGGIHFRDDDHAPEDPGLQKGAGGFASRSCHDVGTVRGALGRYDAVFIGPVFASLSKPGYGPMLPQARDELRNLLAARTTAQQSTEVVALGGVTTRTLADCHALGFDGAALLGAVWDAPDPVAAFVTLKTASSALSAASTRTPSP